MAEGKTDETTKERYLRQTTEIYATLGRFVTAFELTVHEIRSASIRIIPVQGVAPTFLDTIFHHRVMTAEPLFEIFRALVLKLMISRKTEEMSPSDAMCVRGVLAYLATEWKDLVEHRNTLLH